jgi:hypothetical protein
LIGDPDISDSFSHVRSTTRRSGIRISHAANVIVEIGAR